jgi:hypothetical protein
MEVISIITKRYYVKSTQLLLLKIPLIFNLFQIKIKNIFPLYSIQIQIHEMRKRPNPSRLKKDYFNFKYKKENLV